MTHQTIIVVVVVKEVNLDNIKFNTIFILLGTACNMQCRHCSQLPVRVGTVKIEKCDEKLLDKIFLWSKGGVKQRVVWFWGGEPLLYLETIKDIVQRLEDKGAKLRFNVTTNGLLLTDELAEYFNKHNFRIVLSYDAPNPLAVRQCVPKDEAISAFLKIKNRTVNTVFSPDNCDVCDSIDYLNTKFPDTYISIGFMQVMSPIPKDTYTYKEGTILSAMQRAAQRIKDDKDGNGGLAFWFKNRVKRWRIWDESVKESWLNCPIPPCMSGEMTMTFDLKGNYYPCHNGSITLGDVTEDFDALHEKTIQFWKDNLPSGCLKCEHLDMCRNRCPMAMRKGDCYEQCGFMKEYWSVTKQVADEYGLFKPEG